MKLKFVVFAIALQNDEVIKSLKHSRYWELDLLRTLAIAMMILYHLLFDLSVFYGFDIDVNHGLWKLFARCTAILFLLLSGMSTVISEERKQAENMPQSERWQRRIRRSSVILAAAMTVSLATAIVDPQTWVRFGILHLVGVGTLLLPFFLRYKHWNLLLGALITVLGFQILGMPATTPFLIPLGFMPPYFQSVDYFPLLPWFGIMLIGAGLGHLFYVRFRGWRPDIDHPVLHALAWPGRHSLLLYLVHQPVIVACLWMLMGAWK